ncbi:phosphatidylserine decarboxylase [Kitasatospora sp. MBT66]|uniref:phosphatidylserine decarboxylase n=1 Tax=Kitasatospora sp. MBT66 TaxID=1444769 RepID=UPI000A57D789|nr:phosphatidylserine decarboxylase [Kitasatospora sp. MBT66]
MSCILLPDTYHRYHAPGGGEVVEARDDIGGVYYGMKDFPALLDEGNVGYGFDYSMFDDPTGRGAAAGRPRSGSRWPTSWSPPRAAR